MEGKKYNFKDLEQVNEPLEPIREVNKNLIDSAREELEGIKGALIDLSHRIIEEKPDMVVFLDKGARLFAVPFFKFLKSRGGSLPEIKFYNDNNLKGGYLSSSPTFGEIVERDFIPYKGKKIFFIDETFSAGKAAAAISEAVSSSGVDGYYFALTKDPSPGDESRWHVSHKIPYKQIQNIISKFKENGRINTYNNEIRYLFSKWVATRYVTDSDTGKTVSRYQPIPPEMIEGAYDYENSNPPNVRKYMKEPKNMNWQQFDMEVRTSNRETVLEIQKLILETLKQSE